MRFRLFRIGNGVPVPVTGRPPTKRERRRGSISATIVAVLLTAGLSACSAKPLPRSLVGTGGLPTPSKLPADNTLLRAGFLDASLYDKLRAPNHAVDSTGARDSTQGLQDALNDAYEYGLTLYLRRGTYTVSATLYQEQRGQQRGCAESIPPEVYGTPFEIRKAPSMVGQQGGPRPIIVLRDGSPGFGSDNEDQLKPVVSFRNVLAGKGDGTWNGNDACAFGLVFRGVDIKTGRNPGAIGLQMPSAQFSSLEDVRIDATGGYAGVRGLPARTNSATNLEVIGGRYGVLLAHARGFNLVGVNLKGQTAASLSIRAGEIAAVTNFRLEPGAEASAVEIARPNNGLFLQDGMIIMPQGTKAPMIRNDRGGDFYLRRVTVQSNGLIAARDEKGQTRNGTGQPQTIEEYAFSPDPDSIATVINGNRESRKVTLALPDRSPVSRLAAPTTRAWDSIPAFDDPGVVNVMTLGARGDGQNDDTAAIQKAIDSSRAAGVFLPRGDYLIRKPLTLGLETKFFGVPGYRSRIIADFGSASTDYAIRTTEDSAGAGTTYLGDIGVILPSDSQAKTAVGGILWRVGGRSIGRQVSVSTGWEHPISQARQLLRVSGAKAGGTWYGFMGMPTVVSRNKDFRSILIENTAGPLTFYGLNTERSSSDFLVEINRSANVGIYGTKTETGTRSWARFKPELRPFALVQNSRDITIGGFTGLSIDVDGRTSPSDTLQFVNSDRILAAIVHWTKRQHATSIGPLIVEERQGKKSSVPPKSDVVLFRRD